MGNCPSCGRYIGPADACPYCGASAEQRLPIRVLRYASLALGVLGLVVLWTVAANRVAAPRVTISEIAATMNMAYVGISGQVDELPKYSEQTQTLTFWLNDGSGRMLVSAFRKEARALAEFGRVPALGDRIQVEGTLRVRDDFTGLTINAPDRLQINRAAPISKTIAAVLNSPVLERVHVSAQVRQVSEPYSGLLLVNLRDDTGAVDLALPTDSLRLTGGKLPDLHPGDVVQVTAVVSSYKDSTQLVLVRANDLLPMDTAIVLAAEQSVASLAHGRAGGFAHVRGQITAVRDLTDGQTREVIGCKYTVEDGTGEVTVLVWDSVAQDLSPEARLAVGTEISAQGVLQSFRGESEIVPEISADLRVTRPASTAAQPLETSEPGPRPTDRAPAGYTSQPAATRPVPGIPIGQVSADQEGRILTLTGQVTAVSSYQGGFKFILADVSGQITLLLHDSVYKTIPRVAGLRPGAQVLVQGRIQVYQGTLEIVPGDGEAVHVLTESSGPDLATRAIGSLGRKDLNQIVAVEGTAVRVTPFSGGMRVTLGDAGNQVTVLLWSNVLTYIANKDALVPGAQMRVIGVVNEYRGEVEIVPQLGYDVTLK